MCCCHHSHTKSMYITQGQGRTHGTKAYVDPYQRPGCYSNWLAPWPRAGNCGFTWLPWENHPQVASNNYTNNVTRLAICSTIIAGNLQHLSNYCTMWLNNWQVKSKQPPSGIQYSQRLKIKQQERFERKARKVILLNREKTACAVVCLTEHIHRPGQP